MCGGDLALTEGQSVAECEYCGSRQTVPAADNEKKLTLFARANRLRAACEFDKAAGIYESIVADFPEEAEAYWGLVLCKYGIEYVDDPATGKKIPTCHRSSFDSVMEDGNFEQALENADGAARKVYREEAKQLEEIRKGIISVSANEEPYDIFICYKETDENGDRTLDSVLAQDLYDALTEKEYRVFFARITLEEKLGQEYEPYIFAALNSAKVMLAVGTDYEYYNAVWVKNEWSRYLKLMEQDKSKHLIPCYKSIDAYDMPKEFAKLQAQDLGKVGAMQDLLRGIEKILPRGLDTVKDTVIPQAPGVQSLLKRVFMFLEDGNWSSADDYCEKILDIDPECAEAYLGKLMSELRVGKLEDLKGCEKPFDNNRSYSKVLRYGGTELKATLTEYIAYINDRNEKARLEKLYNQAKSIIYAENTLENLYTAVAQLRSIPGYRDADELRTACEQMIETAEEKRKRQEEKEAERQKEKAARADAFKAAVAQTRYRIAAGPYHSVALKIDGTVVAAGHNDNGRCDVDSWDDIIAVGAGYTHTVGLRSDGTVVAVGSNTYHQCDVSHWCDIVAISAGSFHTVGLRADGKVVATGEYRSGQCSVDDWTKIVAIRAGTEHTVGLRSDGRVVATGDNDWHQCNVSDWKNIVDIGAGHQYTVGLRADGRVVKTGSAYHIYFSSEDWSNIVALSSEAEHTVGLRADGSVVAVGDNSNGQCNVSDWKDIVAISAGRCHTIGLRRDGSVVATGREYEDQCNVAGWKLFEKVETIEEEHRNAVAKRNARMKQQAEWRACGKCQHCGGELKGFFGKKCIGCGRPKDY